MSLEAIIESELADYLAEIFPNMIVESAPNSKDEASPEQKSERCADGGIFIYYCGAKYSKAGGSRIFAKKLKYKALIVAKNRREHNGAYDIMNLLIRKVYDFEYEGIRLDIIEESLEAEATAKGMFKGFLTMETNMTLPV